MTEAGALFGPLGRSSSMSRRGSRLARRAAQGEIGRLHRFELRGTCPECGPVALYKESTRISFSILK